jgi:hypothetical protein
MPCRRVRQIFPTLAQNNPTVQFLVLEVDKNDAVKSEFRISTVPDLRFYKGADDGKPTQVGQVIGAQVPEIKGKIASLA